jgi:hypothetical protein
MNGYMATYAEAQRDIQELRSAFYIINKSLDYYNAIQPDVGAAAQRVTNLGINARTTCRTVLLRSANPVVSIAALNCAFAGGVFGLTGLAVQGIAGLVDQ